MSVFSGVVPPAVQAAVVRIVIVIVIVIPVRVRVRVRVADPVEMFVHVHVGLLEPALVFAHNGRFAPRRPSSVVTG